VLTAAVFWLLPIELLPGVLERLHLAGPAQPQDWTVALTSLAVLGVVGTGAAVLAFIHLVVKEGPLFAGMVTYVVPTLAILWGVFDGETITSRQLIAIAGVLAMVALVQFGGRPVAAPATDATATEPHFCPSENPADAPVGEATVSAASAE
jgi:drug/metabolite transporter (DMT)-like permease